MFLYCQMSSSQNVHQIKGNWNKALSASTGHYGAAEPMQCIFSLFRPQLSSEEKWPLDGEPNLPRKVGLTFRHDGTRAESLPETARAAPLRSANAAVPSREHFFTRKVANFTEKNANFHSIHDRKRRALSEKARKTTTTIMAEQQPAATSLSMDWPAYAAG